MHAEVDDAFDVCNRIHNSLGCGIVCLGVDNAVKRVAKATAKRLQNELGLKVIVSRCVLLFQSFKHPRKITNHSIVCLYPW